MDTERCKSIDQISAMEASKSHGGLRRTRPTTTEEVINSGNSGKRRRFDPRKHDQEMEIQCRSGADVNFREEVVSSTESGSNCDRVLSPNQELSLDLKAELRFETESETSISSNGGFRDRETSSSSEICLDSEQMESSKKKPAASPPAATSRRKPAPASIPPTAAEIEEFFSVAERKEKERFANKYNYDIVNDVPMDGRYQWVRLKP